MAENATLAVYNCEPAREAGFSITLDLSNVNNYKYYIVLLFQRHVGVNNLHGGWELNLHQSSWWASALHH